MTEKQIALVRHAARYGSFSRAAEALGVAQSTVSREIALLEEEVRVPLFQRTPGGVIPTPAGNSLRAHSFGNLSAKIIRDCRWVAAGQLPELILFTDTLSSILIQPVLDRLVAAAPNLPLQFYSYKDFVGASLLAASNVNVGFFVTDQDPGRHRLTSRSLYREPWLVAAREDHKYWAMSPADRGILRQQNVILDRQFRQQGGGNQACPVSNYCAEFGLPYRQFLEANYFQDQILMLQAGLGVALLPAFAARHLPPDIRLSDELETPFVPDISMVWNRDSRHPGVILLQELCLEQFGGGRHG